MVAPHTVKIRFLTAKPLGKFLIFGLTPWQIKWTTLSRFNANDKKAGSGQATLSAAAQFDTISAFVRRPRQHDGLCRSICPVRACYPLLDIPFDMLFSFTGCRPSSLLQPRPKKHSDTVDSVNLDPSRKILGPHSDTTCNRCYCVFALLFRIKNSSYFLCVKIEPSPSCWRFLFITAR